MRLLKTAASIRLARLAAAVLTIAVCLLAPMPTKAQGNVSRYVYDENGRLRVVLSPSGDAVAYDYDPAGNPTAVRRYTSADFAVLDFSPKTGAAGDQVQIFGVGFGAAANAVAFNGATATIVSWSPNQIVAKVPSSASTGPISVTKSGGGAVQSSMPFTILPRLAIAPDNVTLLPDSTMQFAATLLSVPGNPTVVWSVNGIAGGSVDVGTISQTGLYRAPANALSPVVIRASISGQEEWFGEARVTVTENITYVAASQITVQFGAPARSVNTLVSAVKGIYVSSLSPGSVQRGTSFTLTLNGRDFTGATAVQFLFPPGTSGYGQNDANITVSNIQVNAGGAQLTASVTVNGSAVAGGRMIIVKTAADSTPIADMGVNTIQITP
ncbi:MAG: IPT/TIG domain-containing protein [Blastocatellales bacterium]